MEDVVFYNNLYDLYGCLLTEKQKEYFEDYYFNNLSLSEMAENYEVSRNAISKQLHIVIDKLNEYESKLALLNKKEQLINILDTISDNELKESLEKLI